MSHHAQAVGGPINTRSFGVLMLAIGVGLALTAWRFYSGLGATTALSDGYPWGIWIAYDVVGGTALACGGYACAILIYVLNKGRYHPLIRSAILTSALGYTMAGWSIVLDVGRYWNPWKAVLLPWEWNFNSVLLEVALCIMAYVAVLWLELSPAFLEKWAAEGGGEARRKLAGKMLKVMMAAMPFLVALGVLLPTMHQSSLGSLMLVATSKLDPLWHTPWLPLLFLVSCIMMGYAAVVFESQLSSRLLRLPSENRILAPLSKVMAWVGLAFVVLRFGDLSMRGQVGRLFDAGWLGFFLLLELALVAAPALVLMSGGLRRRSDMLFLSAMSFMLGGLLYRFDVYLVGYSPGPGWSYFPSVPELFITVGIIAIEIALYIVIVKRFPILAGLPAKTRAPKNDA